MKATLHRCSCIAVTLLVVGCAHKQEARLGECDGCSPTSVYLEGGQPAISHLVGSDPSAVERVAASYCQDHHLGKPLIKQPPEIKQAPEPSKSPRWAIYSFKCEDLGTAVVAAQGEPDLHVGEQPAVRQTVGDAADKFDATCAGMGFQKDTPEYGNCIMKLKEMAHEAEQLRQQRRKQAIKMIEDGLRGLSPPSTSPATTTIRLPGGEVLTCTQTGSQVNCN